MRFEEFLYERISISFSSNNLFLNLLCNKSCLIVFFLADSMLYSTPYHWNGLAIRHFPCELLLKKIIYLIYELQTRLPFLFANIEVIVTILFFLIEKQSFFIGPIKLPYDFPQFFRSRPFNLTVQHDLLR